MVNGIDPEFSESSLVYLTRGRLETLMFLNLELCAGGAKKLCGATIVDRLSVHDGDAERCLTPQRIETLYVTSNQKRELEFVTNC